MRQASNQQGLTLGSAEVWLLSYPLSSCLKLAGVGDICLAEEVNIFI